MKAKEFLSSRHVDFQAVDVSTDAAAMQELLGLGVFRPPVVMAGDRWVRAGVLDDVADLLGIERPGHTMLPPAELFARYDAILATTQRYLSVFPPDKIGLTVPRRERRDMRELGYHIFAIAIDFMEIEDGEEYTQGNGPIPASVRTFDDIIAYGDAVRHALSTWFAAQTDAAWTRIRSTSFGAFPMHLYFERATWHSGQHLRQLAEMLKLAGASAPEPLPDALFAGLPMPQRLWE